MSVGLKLRGGCESRQVDLCRRYHLSELNPLLFFFLSEAKSMLRLE